jgi:DNA-binding beta-propeller fold protein YncE
MAALSVLAVCLQFAGGPAAAADLEVPVKSIAQIAVDDDGRPLNYPSAVFYDPTEEEIYLVNSGSGRVVVYGPDFFPRVSIGVGRGIAAPRGGDVTGDGKVYICQARTRKSPARRITILNGAFFVDQDIILEEIPEAADFSPRQVAVSRDGIIYVAGDSDRGVLVLDKEGTFLRRLQPMDKIRDSKAISEAARQAEEEQKQRAEEQAFSGESEEETQSDEEEITTAEEQALSGELEEETQTKGVSPADIPEEFRPRSSKEESSRGPVSGVGPVRVNFVTIDSVGNLYLVSHETSRIYVYGPDETFLFAFGQKGGTPRHLSQPRSLAIDEERGLIYVGDYMRHSILVYDLAGEYLFEFGGRGFAPGWFNFPSGLAINRHGQIIVADLFNKRIQVLEVEYDKNFIMWGGRTLDAPSPKESDAAGPTGTDEPLPDQPDGGTEDVTIPDAEPPVHPDAEVEGQKVPGGDLPSQPEGGIKEESIPVVEVPGYPDAGKEGQAAPGEGLPGQSETTIDQEIAPEVPPEMPDAGKEEKIIPKIK